MIYLKNEKYLPQDATHILTTSRNVLRDLNIIIRDVRVASNFLELDVSVSSESTLDVMRSKLSNIGPLIELDRIAEKELDKDESIRMARILFNNEKYWKTHEVLEGVWKHTYGDERDLLNGIILVAAALVHYQKGEHGICISIMNRALAKLNNSHGRYHDINIDSLKSEITHLIKSINFSKFTI
jgi:uncharacterized protein